MSIIQHTRAAIVNPRLLAEFALWKFRSFSKDGAYRDINGARLAGFINFSEFHSVSRHVLSNELAFFRSEPLGEGAIIDIGANLGVVSLVLSRLHADRRIYAIEANPTTFAQLSSNIYRNGASNVTSHWLAVADQPGTLNFNCPPNARANASIARPGDHYVTPVPAITLDEFTKVQAIESIALLKIDVEGFEPLVLRGASRLISTGKVPLLYFEVCPALARRAGFSIESAVEKLRAAGYCITRLEIDGSESPARLDRISPRGYENWIARAS